MVKTCRSLLSSGRPCQAPARHHSEYCRHHDPTQSHPAPRAPSQPKPPKPAPADPLRWIKAAHWRNYPATLVGANEQQLQDAIDNLIEALIYRNICHRSAGRILATIANRRLQLAKQKQNAHLREYFESVARNHPEALGDKEKFFKALGQLP
ncbi:MAG TPA: hypothetical protein VHE33_14695 [Acidobacteriaceae bacterium]|nr:hypothetical protein [Acidobacteriaceae bacterium]